MKNSNRLVAMVAIAFVVAIGAMAGRSADAAGPPTINLGSAANFSVLAGSAVTNTGPTTADRDVGVWAGSSVTGFTGPPNGTTTGTIQPGNSIAQTAQTDLTAAFGAAASAPVTANYAALGGLTLVGGVYSSGGATLDLTGTLTLDGQNDPSSVWIFRATSDLVTASSSRVSFINGASPCNVFWRVVSSAALGSGSTFAGTIMADQSVTVADGVTVYGRALASIGLVSLINDRFLTSSCAGGASVPIPPTRPPYTSAPSATPTVAPTATPLGTAAPTAAPTVAAAAPTAAPAPVAGVQVLPSTSTGEPFGPLLMLGIALTGIGILVLRRQSRHS